MTPDDFYIGYETDVPAAARPRIVAAVAALLAAGTGVAIAAVLCQQPFADASFAFGVVEPYEGVVRADPDPVLETGTTRYLLVGPGKHGARPLIAMHDGERVRLRGSLIQRGDHRMLQIEPGSLAAAVPGARPGPSLAGPERLVDLGERTLRGEIVDAKCYLGVMNPGEGAVHRDCAGVCIRGGIPARLLVRSADGQRHLVALATSDGAAINAAAAALAGRAVEVTGRLQADQAGEWRIVVTRMAAASR